MAVVATTTYLYVNTSLTQFFVQGSELVDRGPWSSSAFYAVNDVIQIGVDQYIALQANTNAYPTGIVDNNWSTLVIVEEQGGTSVPSAGSDAYARMTAEAAYFWGTTAYVIGTDAYNLAVTGTNMVLVETGSRIAADAAIVAFVFGSLAVDLAAEAGSRIAADLTEAGTRSQEDQYLQNQIIAETGSRVAADNALIAFVFGSIAVDLSAETGSRIAADLNLTWAGTNETTSRIAGDQQIITIVETGTNTANSAWALAQLGTISPPLSTLPDVNIPAPTAQQVLTFDGSRWSAANAPSTVGAGNVTFFLDNNPSGTLTYDQLTAFPTGGPEVAETLVVTTGSGQVAFMDHLSDFLNRTRIDAGLWEFNNYVSVDTASAMLRIDILVRSISGTETFLFTANTDTFNSITPFLDATISSQGSYLISTTDKLLARFYGSTTSTSPVTVSVYHQGSEHQSHFHTPLVLSHNDLAGLQGGTTGQFYHVTLDENNALLGTGAAPSNTNRYVTADTLAVEQGTRSLADQVLANAIVAEANTRSAAIVTEQGTRSQEDQNLQNQIGVIQGILGQSFAGTLALYTAQVLYAKPDTAFTIVNGVITGRSDLYYSWEDFEYYGTTAGTTPLLAFDKSTSWGDVGIVYTNNLDIGVNGTDSMNLYSVGTMTQTSDSGGTGWTSAGSIYQQDYWYAFLGTETFDYAVGTLSSSGSEMTGGAGWIGSAVVYSGSNRP